MKRIDLTKGKIFKVILTLAIPLMASSFLQFTYNLVDMIWVGNLGSNAVASIGSASFFIGLGYSLNAMVIIGTGIKVAHSIGNKNEEEAKKYIKAGCILNGVIGLVYGIILILFGKAFIGFLEIGNIEVEKEAYRYLTLSAPTLFFSFYNSLYTRIFGSYGNNKRALKISAIGIVCNIILDPIFIYIFKLGVLGAAIATLIANLIMFILFQYNSKGIFKIDFKDRIDYKKVREIARLGFPMSFQRVLFTFVSIILAKIIAQFGSDAIAAQKIGLQIESITYMVIAGVNGALSSFVGQNFGAGKYDRIKRGYKTALLMGVVYSIFTAIIFIVFPDNLARLFVREENTIVIVVGYLQIIAFSQILASIEIVSNGLFTGIGKPKIPAIISIIFTVLRIPMAIIFIKFLGINGVWWSISLSSIFKGITSYLMYIIIIRKVDIYERAN